MVLQKCGCSGDSCCHDDLVQHVCQRRHLSYRPLDLRSNSRFSQVSIIVAAQIYVASDAPRCTSTPDFLHRVCHICLLPSHYRRTGKQNLDYSLLYQRIFVIPWHQAILRLAKPSACQGLGRDDTRGKSLEVISR